MAQKNFDEGKTRTPVAELEPHVFMLGGESFRTKTMFPPAWYIEDHSQPGAASVISFINRMLLPEDRDRFKSLLENDTVEIELEDLLDVSNWLVETIADRPTNGSTSSEDGPENTSDTSTETESDAATDGGN